MLVNHQAAPDLTGGAGRNGDSSFERPMKRQKTEVACDSCRLRKVRCDGVRPVCNVCLRRRDKGATCKYDDEREITRRAHGLRDSPSGSRYPVSSSRQSPYQPSKQNGQSSPFRPAGVPMAANESVRNQGFGQIHNSEETRRSGSSEEAPPSIVVGSIADVSGDKSKGIDSMTGVIGDQAPGHGFFGSSSAGSFMRQIKSAIDVKVGSASRRHSLSGTNKLPLFVRSPESQPNEVHKGSIEYVLPSRKTSDKLVAVYWNLVHPLYPFLDRQRFEEAYQSIWSGSTSVVDERIFMCTLNVVFALACQLAEFIKPGNREESGKTYFKRAQELLQLDLWDIGSAELIQCLLLMGQYLQSTNIPHQCWMVVGHAIRIAQGLGLHLPESNFGVRSPREKALSKIIWHGCVLMDRVLSMTFGRPAMISKSLADAVPLPAMIDIEYLSDQSIAPSLPPENQTSKMAFFVMSLRLYDIIYEILLELYVVDDQNGKKSQHGLGSGQRFDSFDMATILKLDRELMKWGQTLPLHLRISSLESSENLIFWRQAVVCRSRFLHARILLFRPVLSCFCLPETNSGLSETAMAESLAQCMVLQCSTLCVRAAHEVIELIHSNLEIDGRTGPLPAWWYCILYIYTAASVLLAARLRPVIESNISEYSIAASWSHAIEILKSFECLGQSAPRCVAALEILSAKVSREMPMEGIDHTLISQSQDSRSLPVGTPSSAAAAAALLDVNLDEFSTGFDFGDVQIDLSDMSWLNIMPGNL